MKCFYCGKTAKLRELKLYKKEFYHKKVQPGRTLSCYKFVVDVIKVYKENK